MATGAAGGLAVAGQWPIGKLSATETSGSLGDFEAHVRSASGQSALVIPDPPAGRPAEATEDNILGPYFREGAPYRGKVTPPLEPGQPLVVFGRVLGLDTARPPQRTVIHVWQANADGRYDNDDPEHPPAKGVFINRARIGIDETGYYEYETIHPGRYRTGPTSMRPAHIHYHVEAAGYESLTTQMYFEGDPENAKDPWVKPSLIVKQQILETPRGNVEVAEFNIVLRPLAGLDRTR
ncbi:MAG: hypothetical protein KDA83_13655 [Planctomycetales bacterium]|nr:hypothetical protein [Planctomycetales bacterium]